MLKEIDSHINRNKAKAKMHSHTIHTYWMMLQEKADVTTRLKYYMS